MISSWNEIVAYSYNEKHSGNRGVFFGGYGGGSVNRIEYITIPTTGNSLDFGDLPRGTCWTASASNGFIGVVCGGSTSNGSTPNLNYIEKITFSTIGNSVNVGELPAIIWTHGACSNHVRMIIGGGDPVTAASIKYMDYSSMSSFNFFGNLTNNARFAIGCCSNNTIGIFCNGGNLNIIDYVYIMTLGNAVDFGDSLIATSYICGASSDTRAVFHLGNSGTKQLQYVTYSTLGNAILFGTLTNSGFALGGCSNLVRGIFGSGTAAGSLIEYITFSTLSNGSTFGHLPNASANFVGISACSGD